MGIIERAFVYKGSMKVSSSDLTLASSGKKTCTIRLGMLGVQGDVVYMTDGRERLKVRILDISKGRLYRDLTEEDARSEGMTTLEELEADLRRYYGNIDPLQPVTVITFELCK